MPDMNSTTFSPSTGYVGYFWLRLMSGSIYASCIFVATCLDTVASNRSGENQFRWDETNSRMSSAREREDFATAAQGYRKLIMGGAQNGPLFYNYGVALLRTEAYNEATVAFLRAERHLGSNADIRRNLMIAATGEDGEQASLPWYRVLLFWHYGLAGVVRTTIAVSAFFLLWFTLALRVLQFPGLSRHLLPPVVIVLLLFSASVGATLYSENRDQNQLLARDAHGRETYLP